MPTTKRVKEENNIFNLVYSAYVATSTEYTPAVTYILWDHRNNTQNKKPSLFMYVSPRLLVIKVYNVLKKKKKK